MTISLRHRMMLRLVVAVVLILAVSGVILNHFVSSDMRARFDARLLDRAELLTAEVELRPEGVVADFREFNLAGISTAPDADLLQLTGPDGQVHFLSPSRKVASLPVPDLAAVEHAFADSLLADGRRLRWVHLGFHPEVEDTTAAAGQPDESVVLTLSIGRETKFLDQALLRFRLIMLAVAVVTILVLMIAVLALIRATLAPVESLAVNIAALDPTQPGARFTDPRIPPDFQPIVRRLNELLARLEAAFIREKTFVADFSHEMRTPLAGLRTTLEVGLLQKRSPEDYQATLRECLAMSTGMQQLIETMLTLKRMENGVVGVSENPFSVDELVGEIVTALAGHIDRKGMVVEVSIAAALCFKTDRALFALAVRNILDNAVSHGDTGGTIRITGTMSPAGPCLEIANTGCRLNQAEAEALRARFRRGDPNRDASTGHTGLGLAVVDGVGQVLGISIGIRVLAGGIYQVRFTRNPSGQVDAPTPRR